MSYLTIEYCLTSPDATKVNILTPLESSQRSGSDDMHHYLTSQKLAVCPVKKVCHK